MIKIYLYKLWPEKHFTCQIGIFVLLLDPLVFSIWNGTGNSYFTDTVIAVGGVLFCRISNTFWNSCCQGKQNNEGYLILEFYERDSPVYEKNEAEGRGVKWGRGKGCEMCWEQRSFSVSRSFCTVCPCSCGTRLIVIVHFFNMMFNGDLGKSLWRENERSKY